MQDLVDDAIKSGTGDDTMEDLRQIARNRAGLEPDRLRSRTT